MRVLRRAVPVLLPSGANTSVSPLSGFRAGARCTDETSVYFRQVLGMIPFLWKTMCRPAPWKRRSVTSAELFQVSRDRIAVGLISEQDQYAPANHRCNQTVGFLCFCREEHVEKTRAPSERAGTRTVLSDGALLKCMFMHSCFSTSSGYADEASAASNKKKTPPQHAVTAAGQRGLC